MDKKAVLSDPNVSQKANPIIGEKSKPPLAQIMQEALKKAGETVWETLSHSPQPTPGSSAPLPKP